MRIAFFSDIFFPEISGIADSIITTGQELMRRGHTIMHFVPKYSRTDYKLIDAAARGKSAANDLRRDLPVCRLPALSFPGSPTGQWRFVIPHGASLRCLKKFAPDIIHAHTPFGTGFEALLASRVLRTPLIGTNHTPVEEFVGYVPLLGDKLSSRAGRYVAWYYNHCAYLTAPYKGLIDDMRRMKFVRPAQALPNPVSLNAFKMTTADRKRQIKESLCAPGPLIMYAGRLAAEKHIDVIIRAVARLIPRLPVTLIITGHGGAEAELRRLACELNISDRMQFTGFVSGERLAELYQAADVFVMMSTAESQSLALMQALASGAPAVVARARGLSEYITPECGFTVEPGDEQALAWRLEQLLADANLRTRMGASGAEWVKQYAPEIIAYEWEKIYGRHIAA